MQFTFRLMPTASERGNVKKQLRQFLQKGSTKTQKIISVQIFYFGNNFFLHGPPGMPYELFQLLGIEVKPILVTEEVLMCEVRILGLSAVLSTHSTGRSILYVQPISKLTSQCEIRTL